MKPQIEPAHLSESPVPLVADVIRAARDDLPSAARMNALSLGIAGRLGIVAGVAAGVGGPAALTGGQGASGAAGAPLASGAAGAPLATTAVAAKAVVIGLATVAIVVAGAGWWANRAANRTSEPAPIPSVGPTREALAASSTAPAPETSPEPPPAPAAEHPTASSYSPEKASRTSRPPPPTASPAPSAGDADRSAVEMDLLRRAQLELSRKPDAALAICAEHQARFPSGAFAEEREVIAIDCLFRLGRREEGAARADRFLVSYPRSGHRPRVEALVGRP